MTRKPIAAESGQEKNAARSRCQVPSTRSCLVLGAVRDDLRRYCSDIGKEMTMKAMFAFAPGIHVLGAERVGAEWVVSVSAPSDGLCPACGCRSKARHSS
jgi:hypothetical protein